MQKVTVAYKNRDLLQLLELQLTVEQIDQNEIDAINEDRLRYFNKILQRQSRELKQEIEEIELFIQVAIGLADAPLLKTPTSHIEYGEVDTEDDDESFCRTTHEGNDQVVHARLGTLG